MQDRQHVRIRAFLGAKIVLEGGFSVFDCIVKDLSQSGARLKVENAFSVPPSFTLLLSDGRSFEAMVRWRRIDAVGVCFVESDAHEERGRSPDQPDGKPGGQ